MALPRPYPPSPARNGIDIAKAKIQDGKLQDRFTPASSPASCPRTAGPSRTSASTSSASTSSASGTRTARATSTSTSPPLPPPLSTPCSSRSSPTSGLRDYNNQNALFFGFNLLGLRHQSVVFFGLNPLAAYGLGFTFTYPLPHCHRVVGVLNGKQHINDKAKPELLNHFVPHIARRLPTKATPPLMAGLA